MFILLVGMPWRAQYGCETETNKCRHMALALLVSIGWKTRRISRPITALMLIQEEDIGNLPPLLQSFLTYQFFLPEDDVMQLLS